MDKVKKLEEESRIKILREEVRVQNMNKLITLQGDHPLINVFKKTYQNPSDKDFERADEYDSEADQAEKALFMKISSRINFDNHQIDQFDQTSPMFYNSTRSKSKKMSEGGMTTRDFGANTRKPRLGSTLSNFRTLKSRSSRKYSGSLMSKNENQRMPSIRLQTPLVSIKSNVVYTSPREAFKMLNSNKIIKNEFNKVVEGIRTEKFMELAKTTSAPNLRNKFENNTPKRIQTLKDLKMIGTARRSYRKQPKIRISQLPAYEGKRKTVKMDPKALRAGIARFILRSVKRSLPNSIPDNPFTKIIQMPQMMGFDNRTMSSQFSGKAPLFYWKIKNISSWSPNSREQAACVFCEECIVLIGGLNSRMLQDVNVFNVQKGKWFPLKFNRTDAQPEPRYGHTAVVYGSNIYVYGGYRRYVESFKIRETYGDIYSFNTSYLKWEKLNCNGEITFRRNHICEVVGNYMLVHGGLNHKSEVIGDIHAFNFKTQFWQKIKMKKNGPDAVSHHRSCIVMHPYMLNKNNLDLFKSHIPIKKLENPTIKEMGIYVFGGTTLSNDLWILKIGIPKPYWIKPKVLGKAPPPRYGHSMHFVGFMNSVIIFGGRTPSEAEEKNVSKIILNDMYILRTNTLEWVQVVMKGDVPKPVYSHCSILFGSEILIFGGINDNKLNDNNINVCELHQVRARELADNDEMFRIQQSRMEKFEREMLGAPKDSSRSHCSIILNDTKSSLKKSNKSIKSHQKFVSFIKDEQQTRREKFIAEHVDKLENEEYSFLKDEL
ncbi:unnamed protein product [Moneuplotes crassus]|uniref:Kelch motif family protein n=1 Tax=Euplotes crassus TaxID=5936 RepID=A0AAD2D9Z3_EUPCR|nr:unnamed protein product [Moneuplotes crassus]